MTDKLTATLYIDTEDILELAYAILRDSERRGATDAKRRDHPSIVASGENRIARQLIALLTTGSELGAWVNDPRTSEDYHDGGSAAMTPDEIQRRLERKVRDAQWTPPVMTAEEQALLNSVAEELGVGNQPVDIDDLIR